MPRKLFLYQLRTLLSISGIWLLSGIVFFENLIHFSNDLGVDINFFQFSITFGIIGFIITAALIFLLKPAFNHYPVWMSALIKLGLTVLIFVIIIVVLSLIYFSLIYPNSFQEFITSFLKKILQTHTFFTFLIDMALMTLFTIILLEVTDKYGPGMFWSMLIGEYHNPKKENRIFIFLDINESTTIAEELGHEQYFLMLRRFFSDITMPVLANDGDIYQYVGDEIVVSWKNTPENKLKSLKFIRNTFFLIERFSKTYEERFGYVPRFKAGVHAGEVTAGFVGVLKRELIYTGDTMNTAARIRSMCHDLDESFVISEEFMQDFETPVNYTIEEKGTMEVKGKQEPVKVFAMNFDNGNS
ncbi:MAG: adenylate/guanylate cyclase domain-containing protein [Chitinophagaceae bacterium]